MPLPGSPREQQMQKQFLQEIVEPEVQTTEEVVEDEAPKPKAKKKKATKGRKKVLGLF